MACLYNNFNCILLPIPLILHIEIFEHETQKPRIFMQGCVGTEGVPNDRGYPQVRRLTDGGL